MSENIRIKATPNSSETLVNIQLNQKFDFIEILSLKITQEEAYRRFCSDYGAVVGRVTLNNGFGVPNARVSIFIPISENDINDPEIYGFYPYDNTTTKNEKGYRYNLLPKTNETNDDCYTPTGSFYNKREFLDNDKISDLYCKYYKYTTVTNDAGDFMFFGVPVGSYIVHTDVDLSRIGIFSQKPYDLMREGSSENLFDSSGKFKESENLDTLAQIKTRELSVEVYPFWGDLEQCNVGISRVDLDIQTNLVPSAIFIGSIFGDNDKNSVNKRCRPRRKMGKMGEMTTGSGTINIIRKTLDGSTEFFNVNDGDLIDDAGAWAFQVPMNLDYMITDEYGDLIPTDDTSRGIPTRARVRFKIGMNITGGEGRLRRRANFLVPHNPTSWDDSDYSFNYDTKDKHFEDFYWNKIYSVSNYIARVQSHIFPTASINRNFIGLKEVDDGSNNPAPFNRMDTNTNPIFIILCLIISKIAEIMFMINFGLIPIINAIFILLNAVLSLICDTLFVLGQAICWLTFNNTGSCNNKYCIDPNGSGRKCPCKEVLPYVPYILFSCENDSSGKNYCIGCQKNGITGAAESFKTAFKINNNKSFHYPGSNGFNGWLQTSPIGDAGWTNCQSLALAEALDVFRLDFFNDWLNGSLYAFLLKYKVRRRGKGAEKFCETDCGDSVYGVDNNKNGIPDNDCFTNYIVDTCTRNNLIDKSTLESNEIPMDEGVIKKYMRKNSNNQIIESDFYYPAVSKKTNHKLYATKIINLGAVFDCDWQGIPKFHTYLVDTTYNKPSLTNEYDSTTNMIIEAGFDSPNFKITESLICNVNCVGLFTTLQQCNNIRRLCELGIGDDIDRTDDNGKKVDFKITNNEVENEFIRGMFAYLNGGIDPANPDKIPLIKIDDTTEYDYNDKIYYKFRGVILRTVKQYSNSFYFYFGLIGGQTALNKLTKEYLTQCAKIEKTEIAIIINEIIDDNPDGDGIGSIDISVIGGSGPYIFKWEGPNINGKKFECCYDEKLKGPCVNTTAACGTGNLISNLNGGTYSLVVTDSFNNQLTSSIVVGGFKSIECNVKPKPVGPNGAGKVNITVNNGKAPYNVTIDKVDDNGLVLDTFNFIINGVPNNYCYGFCNANDTPSAQNTNITEGKYILTVTDTGKIVTTCSSFFEVLTPEKIVVDAQVLDLQCFNNEDGYGNVDIQGGIPPYDIEWRLLNAPIYNTAHADLIPKGGYYSKPSWKFISPSDLFGGTYEVVVTDIGGNVGKSKLVTINEPKPILINTVFVFGECTQETETAWMKFGINGNNPPYKVYVEGDTSFKKDNVQNGEIELTNLYGSKEPYIINVTDISGCTNSLNVNIPYNDYLMTVENADWISMDKFKITQLPNYNNLSRATRANLYSKYGLWFGPPFRPWWLFEENIIYAGGGIKGNSEDKWINLAGLTTQSFNDLPDKDKWVIFYVNEKGVLTRYTGGWIRMYEQHLSSKGELWGNKFVFYASYNNKPLSEFDYFVANNNFNDNFNVIRGYMSYDSSNKNNGNDYRDYTSNNSGGRVALCGHYPYRNYDNNGPKLFEQNNKIVYVGKTPNEGIKY